MTDLQKTAWRPQVEHRLTTTLESKYSGAPWIASAAEWPVCGVCQKERMRFVLQLAVEKLPEPLRAAFPGGGLIQFFYASDGCFPENADDGSVDFSPLSVIRRVRPPSSAAPEIDPRFLSTMDQAILGWNEIRDTSDDAFSGDKLGGWEYWTQGEERHACPECQAPMELLYQLNAMNEDDAPAYAPTLFASDGTGHLVFCRTHPDRFYFSWACG